jgi:hypothetical protein
MAADGAVLTCCLLWVTSAVTPFELHDDHTVYGLATEHKLCKGSPYACCVKYVASPSLTDDLLYGVDHMLSWLLLWCVLGKQWLKAGCSMYRTFTIRRMTAWICGYGELTDVNASCMKYLSVMLFACGTAFALVKMVLWSCAGHT